MQFLPVPHSLTADPRIPTHANSAVSRSCVCLTRLVMESYTQIAFMTRAHIMVIMIFTNGDASMRRSLLPSCAL